MYDPKKPIKCMEGLMACCMALKSPCKQAVELNCPVQKYLGANKQ